MPDTSFLADTRDSYDAIAAEYADQVGTRLAENPLDRALLTAFAELVPAGTVADVGCGPGQISAFLDELGVDVVGIDLSPRMIELARRTYPGLRFEVGSMLGLDLADASQGGLLAYYSIIHLPLDRRREAFAEFRRVLVPGGYLMLAFQVGEDRGRHAEAFGKPVSLDWYRQQPDDIAELLHDTGFVLVSSTVRQPHGPEKVPQCFVLARTPH
ncbi:class I SAM-dependent methyltransferase [Actinophytocola sediminis]